jgi:Subtilase family/FG-GAP-like repeat
MKRRHRRLRLSRTLPVALGMVVFALGNARDARAGWPPSPGADLTSSANWPNDPDYSGYWNFFSYLPTQTTGSAPYISADQMLAASGMSIDKAWETSIGEPSVVIAIIDSGIEWDEPDLINKAWLNAKELESDKPENADGSACGGTGALAGYDCNGDGVFTVADYANDPRIAPMASDMCTDPNSGAMAARQIGDVNYNCVIDAGDLIQLFSNGVDEDGNGYVDDIAGWDFYKDDNNPYDDVRYGHGTGEAKDSSAEGNNGIEGIGVCPLCRFVMLRAGNSFIADSNNFAKAVVYATDNGASVVQEALGAVSLTTFARAAIDYAYESQVIVVASMADENSRHHNVPGTYNHTLPVHAIAYNGSSDTTSDTFVDFVNCTNYGGQLMLSVSGTSCSSEATGKTSGVSGLLYSYAAELGLTPGITAEEVMQLQKMTADTINVPQSRTDAGAALYYQSLPNFSQRFGYGRTNVASALAALGSGLIPPEVDIVAPLWFESLYANQGSGSVPLMGRITAARATSYDYTVEWAPGVEPFDSDFQPLVATVMGVPGTTVTGGATTPLATIDVASLNPTHPPDPDSPQGENDRTITLRIQVTAHYPSGDAVGEARRAVALFNSFDGLDTDLLPGFPIALDGSIEGGPKLADIDGDGVRDIVLTTNDGSVHVYSLASGMPAEVPGFPFVLRPVDGLLTPAPTSTTPVYLTAPGYTSGAIPTSSRGESVDSSAAIGDINGDGTLEIVVSTWEGTLYAISTTGTLVSGFPVRLPLIPSCSQDEATPTTPPCMDLLDDITRGSFASPVLADFDGDGKLEIVLAAFDGNVYVFNGDGSLHSGFPVPVHSSLAYKRDHILTTPAVADFNGDGVPDILVGTNETIGNQGNTGFFYIVDGRGTAAPTPYLAGWPIEIPSQYTLPIVGQGTNSSPAIFDIEGNGQPNAFLQGNANNPWVLPAAPGAQSGSNAPANLLPVRAGLAPGFDTGSQYGALSNARHGDDMLPLFSHPSVGDLDQDGTPDIVMSGSGLSLALNMAANVLPKPFEHMLAMWSGKTGHMMPGSPFVLEDYSFLTNQAIADITGDNYPEVIMGTGGYFVHAVDACGREAPNWPKFTGGWMTATPAVGDITGDHTLKVVEATREGFLYAWSTAGTDTGVIQWESFHHDNANTGNYGTTLDQGALELAKVPLDCSMPDAGMSADAGTKDAGKPEAGRPDAGQKATPEAGTQHDAAMTTGVDAGTTVTAATGGGCGCMLVSGPGGKTAWLSISAVLLALLRRRKALSRRS